MIENMDKSAENTQNSISPNYQQKPKKYGITMKKLHWTSVICV
jgi:hypothetical protein